MDVIVNEDKEYNPLVAVASVDICGMKKLTNRRDKCVSASKVLELFVKNASTNTAFDNSLLKEPGIVLYDVETYFADSVYLFADTQQAIGTQVNRLAVKCASLIATGFKVGFLSCASVCVGDIRKKEVVLYGGVKQEIRIGRSMARAHILQESQDWVGGAVESNSSFIDVNQIDYKVPLKKNSEDFYVTKLKAINWVYILANIYNFDMNKVKDLVKKRMTEINGESVRIERKLKNTLNFVDYVFSQDKYNSQLV